MNKRQTFVEFELSGEKLDNLITALRDSLLGEFWSHIPEGKCREEIKGRLEKNILAALEPPADESQAT
jgi:hypothetical protein